MSRAVRIGLWIAGIQGALLGGYALVEHERSSGDEAPSTLSTAPPEEVNGPMPSLSLKTPDGHRFDMDAPDRSMLVHFWATWCPPCREELPGLLAVPETHPVDVLAVALDDQWAPVEAFLEGEPGSKVALGNAEAVARTLGVRSLPVTFLVEPGARLRFRFEGARDWTDPQFVQAWLAAEGAN